MNGIIKAMILAAGYGTRARPLSYVRPKPLFPVLNKPLIQYAIDRLEAAGVEEAVVNAHHLADRLVDDLTGAVSNLTLFTLREDIILGTGGGIRNAEPFLVDGPFAVINSDIYTDIDLAPVFERHLQSGALATLVLHDHERFNMVGLEGDGETGGRIIGFRNRHGTAPRVLAFTGIHVIDPALLARIPEGPGDIIAVYQQAIDQRERIEAYVADGLDWWDAGTIDSYLDLHGHLLARWPEGPVLLGDLAEVEPGAEVTGWASLGLAAKVSAGAVVKDSVLWPGAVVAPGVRIERCVVADGVVADEDAVGRAFV